VFGPRSGVGEVPKNRRTDGGQRGGGRDRVMALPALDEVLLSGVWHAFVVRRRVAAIASIQYRPKVERCLWSKRMPLGLRRSYAVRVREWGG